MIRFSRLAMLLLVPATLASLAFSQEAGFFPLFEGAELTGWRYGKEALHKAIVLSATYRQQSEVSGEALKKDPRNLLLARFPRLRMPAEMVRDHALAASGLLVRRVGGASTFPYQPKNMWDGFNVYKYPEPEQVPHSTAVSTLISRVTPLLHSSRVSSARISASEPGWTRLRGPRPPPPPPPPKKASMMSPRPNPPKNLPQQQPPW